MNRRMIKAYFYQVVLYFSEGECAMISIEDMNPKHAGNAAAKLVREADFWAKEAGFGGDFPEAWLATRPLYQALAARTLGA